MVLATAAVLGASAAMAQGIVVPAGDTAAWAIDVDLSCEDVLVQGTLQLQGAHLSRVRTLTIEAGGHLAVSGGAQLDVSLGWHNAGAFTAGDGTVDVDGACSDTTTFTGNNRFQTLQATAAGQTLLWAAGSEQQVAGLLTLQGQTLRGQGGTARLSLLPEGTQAIEAVGVDNVDARGGQHLAPTQHNLIAGGVAPNWFQPAAPGAGVVAPVPLGGPWSLGVLIAGVLATAGRWRQRSRSGAGAPLGR
ncbi:hypothetical protein CCO03_12910 [Comamonas serinivorans]|uniref:IPTL-CTERM protein sorting domain-containing protein n=1 Tax=Comamonas serinivorans TaxID=1082851 RepID=A0A1Y0EP95_9BURK|nr:hypothetical protein [Comamonas serinivorans]ARU05465.1 hypothetical protein CCO03_12910 [Comamonas serinivorans]